MNVIEKLATYEDQISTKVVSTRLRLSMTPMQLGPTFLPQEELARELVKMTETTPQAQEKPVFYCVMAGAYTSPARRIMEQAGLCTFDAPDKAVLAAKNMCNYAAFRRRQKED